jgi:hypothetical protein
MFEHRFVLIMKYPGNLLLVVYLNAWIIYDTEKTNHHEIKI